MLAHINNRSHPSPQRAISETVILSHFDAPMGSAMISRTVINICPILPHAHRVRSGKTGSCVFPPPVPVRPECATYPSATADVMKRVESAEEWVVAEGQTSPIFRQRYPAHESRVERDEQPFAFTAHPEHHEYQTFLGQGA